MPAANSRMADAFRGAICQDLDWVLTAGSILLEFARECQPESFWLFIELSSLFIYGNALLPVSIRMCIRHPFDPTLPTPIYPYYPSRVIACPSNKNTSAPERAYIGTYRGRLEF